MRTLIAATALTLLVTPAFSQSSTTPNAAPPAQTQGQPSDRSTTPAPNAAPTPNTGTRALTPGQNSDGTPREQSPGNAPQLPGSKGQN